MDKGTKRGNSHIEAKSRVLVEGVRVIEELDAVEVQCREFGSLDPSSPAVSEDTFVNREGGDPATDFISIRGVHLHLHLKLHAAREHLMGCLTLIGSKGEEPLMNPIRSLARSAFESSVTCFWLCNNQITTEERLRRFSQLHLRSTYNALRDMGIDINSPPDPTSIPSDIALILDDCNALIGEVNTRGWLCRRGKTKSNAPTVSRWVRELPTYSDMVRDASSIIPMDSADLRNVYSSFSGSVHSDPVTMAGRTIEANDIMRLWMALVATHTAFIFYTSAMKLVASWSGVPYPEETIHGLLNIMNQPTDELWQQGTDLNADLRTVVSQWLVRKS